ncbi:MAG: DNA methyltransferase [Cyanobacteriota bacterium]|nr:DNA methyltransferase [Cyanobacteriota bacterium]
MNQPLFPRQLELFSVDKSENYNDRTPTFSDNLSLPIHRWFRYSAGFSANWVKQLIEIEKEKGRQKIIDPFVGSGTTLLAAELCNVKAIGIEAHPFVTRIAQTKLYWRENYQDFRSYAMEILANAKIIYQKENIKNFDDYPSLIHKCFPPPILSKLDSLLKAWKNTKDNSYFSQLSWLALTAILRECSPVGTAQWQYVLPKKNKAKIVDPYEAFLAKIYLMSSDMAKQQQYQLNKKAILYCEDARKCNSVNSKWADLVITSPPYANNYDYADATRLEMSFFGEINNWGDLQTAVRQYLIRSCTQHISGLNKEVDNILAQDKLLPIYQEITETCKLLANERKNHGGKKPYHTMIAAYFSDMAEVWITLRRLTQEGCLVCFIIGDSAPYGIYVPVDKWLGKLAISAGFKSYKFEKIRDRNVKWKNRKHRVPLHEGILWVEG